MGSATVATRPPQRNVMGNMFGAPAAIDAHAGARDATPPAEAVQASLLCYMPDSSVCDLDTVPCKCHASAMQVPCKCHASYMLDLSFRCITEVGIVCWPLNPRRAIMYTAGCAEPCQGPGARRMPPALNPGLERTTAELLCGLRLVAYVSITCHRGSMPAAGWPAYTYAYTGLASLVSPCITFRSRAASCLTPPSSPISITKARSGISSSGGGRWCAKTCRLHTCCRSTCPC